MIFSPKGINKQTECAKRVYFYIFELFYFVCLIYKIKFDIMYHVMYFCLSLLWYSGVYLQLLAHFCHSFFPYYFRFLSPCPSSDLHQFFKFLMPFVLLLPFVSSSYFLCFSGIDQCVSQPFSLTLLKLTFLILGLIDTHLARTAVKTRLE